MIRWLLWLLRTPTAFPADPWRYARNQLGHGYLVGGLGALLLGLHIVLPGYILWEWLQRRFHGADLSDGIEDFANVATIGFAAAVWQAGGTAWPAFIAIHTIYLAAGMAYRREQQRATEA